MCASPIDILRSGPPPPRVAFLPDAVFFSRAIAVPAAASEAEVVSQVGLSLEALSPFPLAQLYHGYYRPEGAAHALAFAAYRRRFTAEQTEAWKGADLVIPAFAALLGCVVEPSTTVVLAAADGLTAIHWDRAGVPSLVLFSPLAEGCSDDERARIRGELIRAAGEARTVVDAPSPAVPRAGRRDGEVLFEAGSLRSSLAADVLAAIDVRDKADLASLARARRRDIILWRVTTGSLAACLFFLLCEVGLVAGGFWQAGRVALVAAQKPTVERIMDEQDLASRIDKLSTERLLPLEMISQLSPEVAEPKNPPSIQFLRAQTSGQYTLIVEAKTGNAGEIAGYKSAIEQNPACERVEIKDQHGKDNEISFTLVVTFKPGALTPASS